VHDAYTRPVDRLTSGASLASAICSGSERLTRRIGPGLILRVRQPAPDLDLISRGQRLHSKLPDAWRNRSAVQHSATSYKTSQIHQQHITTSIKHRNGRLSLPNLLYKRRGPAVARNASKTVSSAALTRNKTRETFGRKRREYN